MCDLVLSPGQVWNVQNPSNGMRQFFLPISTTSNGKHMRLGKKERTPKKGKEWKTNKEEMMNNERDSKSSTRNVSGICSSFVPTARTNISYASAGKQQTAPHNRLLGDGMNDSVDCTSPWLCSFNWSVFPDPTHVW